MKRIICLTLAAVLVLLSTYISYQDGGLAKAAHSLFFVAGFVGGTMVSRSLVRKLPDNLEAVSKFVAADVRRRKVAFSRGFPPPHVGGYIQNGILKPLLVFRYGKLTKLIWIFISLTIPAAILMFILPISQVGLGMVLFIAIPLVEWSSEHHKLAERLKAQ